MSVGERRTEREREDESKKKQVRKRTESEIKIFSGKTGTVKKTFQSQSAWELSTP